MKNLKNKTTMSVVVFSLLLMCLNAAQAKVKDREVKSKETKITGQHGKCHTKKYKLVQQEIVRSSSSPIYHKYSYNKTVKKVKRINQRKATKGACVRALSTRYTYKHTPSGSREFKMVYSIVLYNSVRK